MLIGNKKRLALCLSGVVLLIGFIIGILIYRSYPAVRHYIIISNTHDDIMAIENEFGIDLKNCSINKISLSTVYTLYYFGNKSLSITIASEDLEQFLFQNSDIFLPDSESTFESTETYYSGKNQFEEQITVAVEDDGVIIRKEGLRDKQTKAVFKKENVKIIDVK